ncbi:MAG: hypothetical protein GEV08_22490 [Acidimicrobiia bacterium]|nr:hypothetical protein [Acidimicrobiia bacterium]
MTRTVILDNEAVRALMSVRHPKHAKVLAHVQVVASRKRRAVPMRVVVPTAVRVEAGWDRTDPDATFINRLRITDSALGAKAADHAAATRSVHGVSVADAHIGAVIADAALAGAVAVVSSDPADMRAVAGTVAVTIVAI